MNKNYSKVVCIRLKPEEREALAMLAEFDSISDAAVLRRLLRRAMREELPVVKSALTVFNPAQVEN